MGIGEVWSTFQCSLSDAFHEVLFLNMEHSSYLDAVNIFSIISANIQNRFQICKRARTVSYLVWYGWMQRMKVFDLLKKHVFAEARCLTTAICFPPIGMWPWFALRFFFKVTLVMSQVKDFVLGILVPLCLRNIAHNSGFRFLVAIVLPNTSFYAATCELTLSCVKIFRSKLLRDWQSTHIGY